MSDETIQAALRTLIRQVSGVTLESVTLGDTRVMGSGKPPYVIIFPGPFRAARSGDWGQVTTEWTHTIELWDRFMGDDYSVLTADRQKIVNKIKANPTLGGLAGVTNCLVTESGELTFMWQRGRPRTEKPTLVGFRLRVTTFEEDNSSGSGEFTT